VKHQYSNRCESETIYADENVCVCTRMRWSTDAKDMSW